MKLLCGPGSRVNSQGRKCIDLARRLWPPAPRTSFTAAVLELPALPWAHLFQWLPADNFEHEGSHQQPARDQVVCGLQDGGQHDCTLPREPRDVAAAGGEAACTARGGGLTGKAAHQPSATSLLWCPLLLYESS